MAFDEVTARLENAQVQGLSKSMIRSALYKASGSPGNRVPFFSDLDLLKDKYPNPPVGTLAYVGSGFPCEVYYYDGAEWQDTNTEYAGEGIDLEDYLSSLEQSAESDIDDKKTEVLSDIDDAKDAAIAAVQEVALSYTVLP